MRTSTRIQGLLNHSASRYAAVGILAFAVDYTLLLFTYYVMAAPLVVATTVGFLVGFVISFCGNKRWAFGGEQRKQTTRQATESLVLLVFNYLFTVGAVAFLNQHGLPPAIGKLLVIAMIMCWNYTLYRWVIFAKKSEAERLVPLSES